MTRMLVYLRHQECVQQAAFTQSVIDCLNYGNTSRDVVLVNHHMEKDRLVLEQSQSGVPLKRPQQCPIAMLTKEGEKDIPKEIISRGVAVGAVALVESADQQVLLTRRAKHMRTFPGVWVPPGGAPEPNESLLQAALRELKEEAGLEVTQVEEQASRVLCLWESVYPPFLERGLPRRHHVVVYFHVPMLAERSVLDDRLRLCPNEVEASAWLNKSQSEALVHSDCVASESILVSTLVHGQLVRNECSTATLKQKAPKEGLDVERVSSGTLFALEEWLKL